MLTPGTILQGKFVIEKILGQGGMGAVYLAHDLSLGGKRVAIKAMQVAIQDAGERERAIKQFHREAQMLANLDHPGLADVTAAFGEGDTEYLVMSLIDGVTLEAVLMEQQGFLAVPQVLAWMDQLCDVLGYLHSQDPPIIFRDLKPGNIMLDAHHRIRLIDFGIARVLEAGTNTTTFIKGAGTPGFSPVEQFGGATTDVRSDVYALGATLYCLLTRTLPPVSVNLLSGEDALVPPTRINAAIPPALATVILRMMGLRKEERYSSMAEVRDALKRVLQPLPPGPDGSDTVVPPYPREAAKLAAASALAPEQRSTAPTDTTVVPSVAASATARRGKPGGWAVAVLAVVTATGLWVAQTRSVRVATTVPDPIRTSASAVVTPGPSGSTSPVASDLPRPGTLKVEGISGFDLKVDGRAMGTNLPAGAQVPLDPGLRRIEVSKPHWQSYFGSVPIVAGESVSLPVSLEPDPGAVRIESTPSGAAIWWDARKVAVTPFILKGLKPGTKVTLRVRKAGYQEQSLTVEVRADATVSRDVTLPRIRQPVGVPPAVHRPAYRPPPTRPVYRPPAVHPTAASSGWMNKF